MPKNIAEIIKKEADIYRGALSLINKIINSGKEQDPEILNCLQKMQMLADFLGFTHYFN